MTNFLCLCVWNRAGAPIPADCVDTKGRQGRPRSSVHAVALQRVVGCDVPVASVQKRAKSSRAALTLLICSIATVTGFVRKDGDTAVQRHSSVRTGDKCAGDAAGILSGYSFYGHDGIFFAVEAADAILKHHQQSYRGGSITVKNWQSPATTEFPHGDDEGGQQAQHDQSARRRIPNHVFTRAAVEEALSTLRENPHDVTEAAGVEHSSWTKRAFEKSLLPYNEVALEGIGRNSEVGVHAGGGVTSGMPVDVEVNDSDERWSEEQAEMHEQVQPREVLEHVRRTHRHLVFDDSEEKTPDTFQQYDALHTVLDDSDYVEDSTNNYFNVESDVGETVEPLVPAAEVTLGEDTRISEHRSDPGWLSLPPVAMLVLVWLIAEALLFAQARPHPETLHVKESSPFDRGEGRRGYISPRVKDYAEEIYLGRDYLVDQGERTIDPQQVAWLQQEDDETKMSADDTGTGAREREHQVGVDTRQGQRLGSGPTDSQQNRFYHVEHVDADDSEGSEKPVARAIGTAAEARYRDKGVFSTSAEISPQWARDVDASDYDLFGAHDQ